MTFKNFTEVVKQKYPKAVIYPHGKFAGNKINVTIVFNGTNHEKVYQYNGTYCEVLNKLGIKAFYKHNYGIMKSTLERYKEENGTVCPLFGITYNYDDAIKQLTAEIEDIEKNYIIV